MQEYAVYKGETLLGIGTSKELSKQLNVTRKTIQYWSTPACHKRYENSKKKNMKIAVKLITKGDDLDG